MMNKFQYRIQRLVNKIRDIVFGESTDSGQGLYDSIVKKKSLDEYLEDATGIVAADIVQEMADREDDSLSQYLIDNAPYLAEAFCVGFTNTGLSELVTMVVRDKLATSVDIRDIIEGLQDAINRLAEQEDEEMKAEYIATLGVKLCELKAGKFLCSPHWSFEVLREKNGDFVLSKLDKNGKPTSVSVYPSVKMEQLKERIKGIVYGTPRG